MGDQSTRPQYQLRGGAILVAAAATQDPKMAHYAFSQIVAGPYPQERILDCETQMDRGPVLKEAPKLQRKSYIPYCRHIQALCIFYLITLSGSLFSVFAALCPILGC